MTSSFTPWFLAGHIIFVICWFAGLFYLPRLYVYHASAQHDVLMTQLKQMEYRLFWYIMTPAGILATLFGLLLWAQKSTLFHHTWFQLKLLCVMLLWCFHVSCGFFLCHFKRNTNHHSHQFYRIYNEMPTVLLIVIVLLATLKPSF